MKMFDYIIVGCGLAGIAFAEQLRVNNKSFLIFDNDSQRSSQVAAGMYNPVILKRFTKVWKVKEQLNLALPVYHKLEKERDINIDYKLKLLRRFASIEEQNLWFEASDSPMLEDFMKPELIKYSNDYVKSEYHFGEVLGAGRIDTKKLISAYKSDLLENHQLLQETFDYNALNNDSNVISYRNFNAKHIIFAEGFGIKKNPFFKDIPLNGTKGEVLTIRAKDLKLEPTIKSSVFVIPLGNDLYKVGSTYNHNDKTNERTEQARQEIISKIKSFIKCDFDIVGHEAGVRPTTKDRRPLVGQHQDQKSYYVLNGLGSRGVMVAPYVANKLFRFIEYSEKLDTEININRFA